MKTIGEIPTGGKFGPMFPCMRQTKLTEYGFIW